jgi:DNA-binding response OmpR family regulator
MSSVTTLTRLQPRSDPGPQPSFLQLLPLRAPRVLVVTDDLDLEPVCRSALRALDPELRLDWARTSEQALGKLRSQPYEAAVVDAVLGRHRPQLPVILMASLPQDVVAPASGRPFLRKPFDVQELRRLLQAQRS